MLRRIPELLLFLLLPQLLFAAPIRIVQQTHWQGEVDVDGPVTVEKGGELRIAAGSRIHIDKAASQWTVQGRLLILGGKENPVVFVSPEGWKGIQFIEADKGSRIEQARFDHCEVALSVIATSPLIEKNQFRNCEAAIKLLRESSAEIRENLFFENGLGLGIEMRSSPQVIANRFIGQSKSGLQASNKSRGRIEGNLFEKNQQGAALLHQYPDLVKNNRFLRNKIGLYCYQTHATPQVLGNRFENNEFAQVNFSFSFPQVRDNRYIKNQTAIQNDQFGSSQVEENLFEKNRTAIFNNRKSNAQIRHNLFRANQLALKMDYSSYPLVRENNFIQTQQGARLGIYQSADWEKRSGSKALVMKNAQQRQSRNPLLQQAPTEFQDQVDLSGNWWGKQTAQLQKATASTNVEIFYDRHDRERVSYPAFGPGSYLLDEIRFLPVLTAPVTLPEALQ